MISVWCIKTILEGEYHFNMEIEELEDSVVFYKKICIVY